MNRSKTVTIFHVSLWTAAFVVGLCAVLYAHAIDAVQYFYLNLFEKDAYLVTLLTPFGFVVATYLVRKFAPEAGGSGIPQVLSAIEMSTHADPGAKQDIWRIDLVSLKTAAIKVISSLIGILSGASIGREGPTIQIAASVFAQAGRFTRGWIKDLEFRTYIIAGAAAGLGAAFNAPLAGIAFAIEELIQGVFSSLRQGVMVAVIFAGITAQALMGNYLYFGHTQIDSVELHLIPQALVIGLVVGAFGGVFAKLLAYPKLSRLPVHWLRRALVCGVLCALITAYMGGDTAGSGYEITRKTLSYSSAQEFSYLFPLAKLLNTVLSYLSGMAGGIFSPCLSIGAGLGGAVAKLGHFVNFKACVLLGMVAFFASVVQAPLTAVIIVMEMTDQHILILAFMISAFLAQSVGKLFMPTPLYVHLAGIRHEPKEER